MQGAENTELFHPGLGGCPQRAPDMGSGPEVAAGGGQRAATLERAPPLFCVIGIWVMLSNHRSLLTVPPEQGGMPDPIIAAVLAALWPRWVH